MIEGRGFGIKGGHFSLVLAWPKSQGKEGEMKARTLFLVFVVVMLASNAFAGWMITQATRDITGKKEDQTVYLQQNKVKTVMSDATMMFDLDKELLYLINPDKKVYWSGKPEDMKKSTEEAQKKMMEEQMKKVPPEQREAMKKYMEQMQAQKASPKKEVKVTVKKTGEKVTIAGYSGQKYQILVNGKLREETWIATKLKNVSDEFDRAKWEKFQKALTEMGGEEEPFSASREYLDLMEKGFSIKSISYYEEGEKSENVTTKVEKKKIPASEFQIPKGYKKVGMAEIVGGR